MAIDSIIIRVAHRGSPKPRGGSQRLKTHQGGLQKLLYTLEWLTDSLRLFRVAHRCSWTSQSGSQKHSGISKWLTETLGHLMVAQRVSQTPHGGSKSLSDTSGWLTEALKTTGWLSETQNISGWLTKYLRHLRVAQSVSQTLRGGSQRISDTSGWLIDSQTPKG